jgi:hypothetical protein
MMPKILVAVLCSKSNPEYVALENTIRETWGTQKHPMIDIIYYDCNDKSEERFRGDTLIVKTIENRHALEKTVAMYEWSLSQEYDYIFRANVGSYVDFEALYNYVKDKPRTRYYAGYAKNADTFASGSGYFISRDLVEMLVSQKNQISSNVDDVAIGSLLIGNGVRVSPAIRYDIKNGVHNKLMGYVEQPLQINDQPYHFRVRHEMGYRHEDVAIIQAMWRKHQETGSPI